MSRVSRFTSRHVRVPNLLDEQRAVETVLEVGQRFGLDAWVLFPTRDEHVAAFARYRDALAAQYRVPTPGWASVQWAWDKRKTDQMANQLGIPAPRTLCPRDLAELDQLDLDLPVAIKPAIKEHFIYATKAKAWRADTRDQLRELFQRAAALVGPGEVMVQELIPGDGRYQFAYCAFFKDGRAIGSMVGRRLRQHPPEFGRASTLAETIDLPLLEELSERFLRQVNYYGLVEMEYKLDPRDGQYKLLDINARVWGYHTLGQRAGVDFPYLLYADQLGLAVQTCRARPGVRWIRLVTDLPTVAVEIVGGTLSWRDYLRSLRGINIESVFARDDPLPGVFELALIPYEAVKRGF
ncbi:MAG: ATP-grasp domain-containing protein [Sphaerobacter sp.]|nr:ATP-grasp domain-containing protein [Sphaerobacter sp.]